MDILPKLEWCCVEILEGSTSFRSILTLQEIQQNNFTGDEIGENIISEGLAGKTSKIFNLILHIQIGECLVFQHCRNFPEPNFFTSKGRCAHTISIISIKIFNFHLAKHSIFYSDL